ncbi:MAG: hypothetical protein K8T26_05890 [Lentisphaerae bacterium]|nr:hypothetical protein [Lentisphaerota bacterium]
MSYEDGWAAVNLQRPARVPRTEVSAEGYHWDLIRAVTGRPRVSIDSPDFIRAAATRDFIKAWNYDIVLSIGVGYNALLEKYTNMGHAEYAQNGRDFMQSTQSPFRSVADVFAFDPWEVYGPHAEADIVKHFNMRYAQQCQNNPNAVNMTGIYTTLMSGMIAIFGWDLLLEAAGENPDEFGAVVNRYASWIQQHYDAVAKSDTTVVYSHDDMVWTEGPFINPKWYRKYIFPNLEKLWAPLRQAGKKILFVCDGNYTSFAADIAACGNHGFWFEIFTDLEFMTRKFGETHFIIGNGDCRVLTFGTKADIRAEVERCMAAGKRCAGYFMCVSGHIPPNVPVENALYYNQVYEELSHR